LFKRPAGDGCPHEIEKRANGEYFAIKTRRLYRSPVKNYILPDPICQQEIAFIRRADAIALRDRIIEKCGYTRKAQLVFQTFKNIMHTALEKGIIETDPVQRLGIAHTREKRMATGVDNLKTLFDPKNWPNPRIRNPCIWRAQRFTHIIAAQFAHITAAPHTRFLG
jgi:hypothetical protein